MKVSRTRTSGSDVDAQSVLPLHGGGQRLVWQSVHGPIVIEVCDGEVFVNGDRVEPVGTTTGTDSMIRPATDQ